MHRKTYITIANKRIELNKYYENKENKSISYVNFRQRVKGLEKRNLLTNDTLSDAIELSNSDWVSSYGGGKKEFKYEGKKYPDYTNTTFPSLAAFLKSINLYEHYNRIKVRLRKNWDIDDALDPIAIDNSIGRIYKITSTKTSKMYIGQTISTLNKRFTEHKKSYLKSKANNSIVRPLYKAFEEFGLETFSITLLEENIPKDLLAIKENNWIAKYNTIDNGLNNIKGAYASGGRKKKLIYQGRPFNSHREAAETISREKNISIHNAGRAVRTNSPVKESYRKVSDHPDSKKDNPILNKLWGMWKSHLNRDRLCDEWKDENTGYDLFKSSIGLPPSDKHKLRPKNSNEKYSKTNFQWLTDQEWQNINKAKSITIKGITYPSMQSVSNEFGIPLSTLFARLDRGIHPDNICEQPSNSTTRKAVKYDNISFKSRNECYAYISKKYNITIGKAKDRYTRKLPFDKPPHAKSCTVNGKEFKSEKQASEYYNINYGTFTKRRKLGWTLYEALGVVTRAKP